VAPVRYDHPDADLLSPRRRWYKLPLFVFSIFLFVLAITLMKDGARDLGPLVRDRFAVAHFADAMGFGWLLSYLIMSGSPVAAAALSLFDAGVIDRLSAYGMIVGSRMGASFIVLFIGFIYVLRGRGRASSLSMGLLSMSVATSIQVLALGIGIWLLSNGLVDSYHLGMGATMASPLDLILEPISQAMGALLPGWALFALGIGLIMVSFSLFDRCLPDMTLKQHGVGAMAQFVYRPWVMFLVGSTVTLATMSVSISLSILVPLNQRGFVRRENIIPYIMGANITTFIDTLLAAFLLRNPAALAVVLAEMISLTVVSALILLGGYELYKRSLLRFVDWTVHDMRRLFAFVVVIVAVPVVLLIL